MNFLFFICVVTYVAYSVNGRTIEKRHNCKPLWNTKCTKDKDCCSKSCEKKDAKWTHGMCGPSAKDLGNPNECKPLNFKFCKRHSDCCSKNCKKKNKDWSYGYCDKGKKEPHKEPNKEPYKQEEVVYKEEKEEHKGETCGIRDGRVVNPRIVGGSNAAKSEIPWQVGLELDNEIRGGGSIINDHWILTAAHVFNGDNNLEEYRGMVGSVSMNEAPIHVFFDKLIIHPEFKNISGDFNNDIALLHTTKKMTLFPQWNLVNSVCLPQLNTEFKGDVTVSGWGNIDDEGTPADHLMAVDVHIKNDDKCEKQFNTSYNKTIMICAGTPEGGKDSCVGDSGGPMVHFKNKVATLVGIVSYGPLRSCGKKGSVAVYTKVSKYVDWINESIKN